MKGFFHYVYLANYYHRKTLTMQKKAESICFSHYQNIPQSIKPIFKRIHASKAVIIATYGKMSFGNVLSETQKLVLLLKTSHLLMD